MTAGSGSGSPGAGDIGPVVAITANTETVSWAIWREIPVALLPWNYISKIRGAGGVPMLVPSVPGVADALVSRADALLLTGGPDLDPIGYGAERDPRTLPSDPARDAAERGAFEVAQRRGIPVLGICRGLQVMAVARGGTLHQHLPDHSPARPGHYEPTKITIDPESLLGRTVGPGVTVQCHHHQGVAEVGAGLVVTAWNDQGGIEAAEDPDADFLVGLQAHLEQGEETDALFAAFVTAAAAT